MNLVLADFSGWFFEIFPAQSVALTMLVVSLAGATGLALGSIKIKGISLGIPGVMFTAMLAAHWLPKSPEKAMLNPSTIIFLRDLGLILFVYAVGVQVGPGFLASLRKRGLPLVMMAGAIVLVGAAIAVSFKYILHTDIETAAGLFSGATTNAPALGSASEAIKSLPDVDHKLAETGTLPAFAITYPFGLIGVILAMIIFRLAFRVDPKVEAKRLEAAAQSDTPPVASMNILLKNPNLEGLALGEIPGLARNPNVVISRIGRQKQDGYVAIARPDTIVHVGDILLAVGPAEELKQFRLIAGEESATDLRLQASGIATRQILVTRPRAATTLDELNLLVRLGVTITRITRADIEFTATPGFRLQFGDRVLAVGEADTLDAAAKELGNSVRALNLPRLLPIFLGLLVGVFLGSIPIIPGVLTGLPAPVKLGLASGPMIVAIILSRTGRIGPVIWYMPHSASALLRELGIVLFLIAVGLLAGDAFFSTLSTPLGLNWLLMGAVITLLPLLLVGLLAKIFFKTNYLHICGLLAGSMTSPSLAFTQTMTSSEAPAVAFATVYPISMILRVIVAQLMILIFR